MQASRLGSAEHPSMKNVESFLRAITDPARPRIPGRTILVFAHPDDETLACGAILSRLDDVAIVHVTDGAPRNGDDARRHGFASPAEYAAARQAELLAAMELAGVRGEQLFSLGAADQGVAFALADIARRIAPMLEGADLVITHTYEGGHPDHDAVCWAVQAGLGMIVGPRPALIEVPLYCSAPHGGWLRQSFGNGPDDAALQLTPGERELKARMIAAHATQAGTLSGFGVAAERYRIAPSYNFSQLPNGGALLYERYGWGLTGQRWLELAADAARALRLGHAA